MNVCFVVVSGRAGMSGKLGEADRPDSKLMLVLTDIGM